MRAYVAQRQAAQAANATISRELAALKRAFRLGVTGQKILFQPFIERLREDNVRQGFFEADQVDAVCDHLPEELNTVVRFGAITGWGLREVLSREWRYVDFQAGTVRLEPGETKNGRGRTFPLTTELRALLEAQRGATERLQRQKGCIISLVFHRQGQAIKDFRGAWRSACEAAGVPGRLFHDLRRTAVRRFEQARIPRSVAMQLSGHQTETVYKRYAIVSEGDLRTAVERLDSSSKHKTGQSRHSLVREVR